MGAVQTLQANHGLSKRRCPAVVLFSTVAVQTGMAYHASIAASKGLWLLDPNVGLRVAPDTRERSGALLTDTSLAASLLGNDAKREAAADRHLLKRVLTAEEGLGRRVPSESARRRGDVGQVMQVDAGGVRR